MASRRKPRQPYDVDDHRRRYDLWLVVVLALTAASVVLPLAAPSRTYLMASHHSPRQPLKPVQGRWDLNDMAGVRAYDSWD